MPSMDYQTLASGAIAAADYSSQAEYSLLQDGSTEGELVVCTANTDVPIGQLRNAPAAGAPVTWTRFEYGVIYSMIASAAISTNTEVAPITGGKIVTGDAGAGDTIIGKTTEAAAADGDLVKVRFGLRTQE